MGPEGGTRTIPEAGPEPELGAISETGPRAELGAAPGGPTPRARGRPSPASPDDQTGGSPDGEAGRTPNDQPAEPSAPQPDSPYVSRGGLKLAAALAAFGPLGVEVAGAWCADLGCSTGGFTDCLLRAGAARVFAVDTAYGELAWKLRQDERVTVLERSNALHTEPPTEVRARGSGAMAAGHAGFGDIGSGATGLDVAGPHVADPDAETAPAAPGDGGVDLVTIDLGWTPQRLALPAAAKWLRPGGRIITLIKPHYEADADQLGPGGVLEPTQAEAIAHRVAEGLGGLGFRAVGLIESPVLGGARGGRKKRRKPKRRKGLNTAHPAGETAAAPGVAPGSAASGGRGNREWLALVEPAGG